MKHLKLMLVFVALSACVAADGDTETGQTGITISGTASMGIARDGG